jgi:hypothetical protein
MTWLRRVLFSRARRLLPMPKQMGVSNSLELMIDQQPALVPMDDQHVLAFLSGLLSPIRVAKLASDADGERTDANLAVHLWIAGALHQRRSSLL